VTPRRRIAASFSLLVALCACGRAATPPPEETAGEVARGEAAPPTGPVTLPDALMPLTEGGEVQPRDPGTASVIARFPNGSFDTLRARVTEWMPANGWTMVPSSETDSARTAQSLEEMGMQAAADLARRTQSWGASYQRAGSTVAIVIDTADGTLQMNISWF
jgi:hypothetical protein